MLDDTKYNELVTKLAGEIIDDAIAGIEKDASEEEAPMEKEAAEAFVKQALEVYEEAQAMKQAAIEVGEEAQLNEDAAMEVLDQLGIDPNDYISDDEYDDEGEEPADDEE